MTPVRQRALIKYRKNLISPKDWNLVNQTNDTHLLKSITEHPLDYTQIIIGQFLNYINLSDQITGFDLIINSEFHWKRLRFFSCFSCFNNWRIAMFVK